MRTLRWATALLESAGTVAGATDLLRALGFEGSNVPVDAATLARLGLDDQLGEATAAAGPGSLRALTGELLACESSREGVARIAARLARRTPHVLWLLIAVNPRTRETVVAIWSPARGSARVAAMVVPWLRHTDSDAETICGLAAAVSQSDLITHTRWHELLGRESVGRAFFRALEKSVHRLAHSFAPSRPAGRDGFDIALVHVSRLLFLCFLETKGWLGGDHAFLANQFADCMATGGSYHRRVLSPLYFGSLNTRACNRSRRALAFGRLPFLNGGLFARTSLEKQHSRLYLADDALGDLFGEVLSKYRFTAREDSSVWSEAAVDPEMLGKSFESLMAADERRKSGAFYTPQGLVRQLTAAAFTHFFESRKLPGVAPALLAGELPPPADRQRILGATADFRLLDPACGSGAFLVYALEQIAALRLRLGDPPPLHTIRRAVLTRSIFGVDVNPMAAWLCELRLWLSVAIEDPERNPLRVSALPNLDRNIRVGDTISGGGFTPGFQDLHLPRLAALRARYVRATGPGKKIVGRMLDQAERRCALRALDAELARLVHHRRDLLSVARTPDLFGRTGRPNARTTGLLAELREQLRAARTRKREIVAGRGLPFSFATHFAEAGAAGGFDVVIGNPPWVRIHNFPTRMRASAIRSFRVLRGTAWECGAAASGAGQGFASQIDLAALFAERATQLARERGTIALLLPGKLWQSLAGAPLRSYLQSEARLVQLHDLTESGDQFDAAVYPSLLVAERLSGGGALRPVAVVLHRRNSAIEWRIAASRLAYDSSPGSPWLLLPPEVRDAFETLRRAGTPLHETDLGRPLLGVKTGCNEAFVVTADPGVAAGSQYMEIRSGEHSGIVESRMLRPLYRGEQVERWKLRRSPQRIIWTHESGAALAALPPRTEQWLLRWRRRLQLRTDARSSRPWWEIFRTESASAATARVVWGDFGRAPRAVVVSPGEDAVLLNSCYVLPCRDTIDALAVAALLNSPLAAAWLNCIAEPARGGYRRYLGWTVSLLPMPRRWAAARSALAEIAQCAIAGDEPSSVALLAACASAYDVSTSQVEPLLCWNQR